MESLSNLVKKYIDASIIHGEESDKDYKKANKNYKIYTKCYCDMCKYGPEGIDALKSLLNHSNQYVRYNAAYDILPFDSKAGIKVLRKCKYKSNRASLSFSAKITLSEWRKKSLTFPIEIDGCVQYVTVIKFIEIYNQYYHK